jgi:signal transduction histidine kinase
MKEYSIFLLEPENLLREVLLNVLEDKGYPVYSFANSWETLSFIKKIKFQIAVIDSDLEISSRDRIISEINSLYPAASIIILTSEPGREELLTLLNYDIAAILLKPVNMAELEEALSEAKAKFDKNNKIQSLKAELDNVREERDALEASLKNTASRLPFALLSRSMVHEFKNILTAINISANFVKKSIAPSSAKTEKHISLIEEAIKSADGLLLRLLGINKSKEESIDINNLVAMTTEMLKPELSRSGIRVVEDFNQGIRGITLDSSKLKQVIINIILNAKEAMPAGGELKIKTYLKEEDFESVVIEISDTGSGIAESDLSKLFSLDYTTKEDGNGIGLYLSKKIVENIGGSIRAESSLGRGSNFIVELPLKGRVKESLK